ncbi:MAG: ergothioneine biosynthesis protein EgtB [Deltaproteobacteria bacterium]|nr:ergothioneine biosynthesis protein EgtB [Deltaproteobacteria bacterium]
MTTNRVDYPLAQLDPGELVRLMRQFRAHTLALVADLSDEQMIGPRLAIVNPPLWEIGHVAWFSEFWVLRHLRGDEPLLSDGDRLYNSTDVAHDTRWELLLPPRQKTYDYMAEVLERSISNFSDKAQLSDAEFYFYLLALFHEGMHAEALAYTRQTLGYTAPQTTATAPATSRHAEPCGGDVAIPGGDFLLGATSDFPFVFDNEKWAHPVRVKPFRIARRAVTNGEFRAFVEAGGYRERQFWSDAGWHWLESGGAPQLEQSFAGFFKRNMDEESDGLEYTRRLDHPVYWRRAGANWQQGIYDRYVELNEQLPVLHVSWYEADAYCRWAQRRLPTEVEWEVAASAEAADGKLTQAAKRRYFPWGNQAPTLAEANLDWHSGGPVDVGAHGQGDSAFGCRQMIGNVWEWTASDFQPYPGFSVDPYKEYSQPWFGSHKVLRGGCWATSSLLIRNSWRNFYTPDRRDVWAGFRTCALEKP